MKSTCLNALMALPLVLACAAQDCPDCTPAQQQACASQATADACQRQAPNPGSSEASRRIGDIKAELAAINSRIAAGSVSDAERMQLYDHRDRLLMELQRLKP